MVPLNSYLSAISRQMSRLCIQHQPQTILKSISVSQVRTSSLMQVSNTFQSQYERSFATSRDKREKNKNIRKKPTKATPSILESASTQHLEWVNFQKSITVEGFETGQTTEVKSTKKTRGGASKRKKTLSISEMKIAERQRLTESGGGQYAPKRFSEEETERLLTQAYAALPERAGKRGTKNLKRQKRRWALVREIRRKYKAHMANHQINKMLKRSQKVKDVKAVLAIAPEIQKVDREYQADILRRWKANMMLADEEASTS